jgi:hypothetical protein
MVLIEMLVAHLVLCLQFSIAHAEEAQVAATVVANQEAFLLPHKEIEVVRVQVVQLPVPVAVAAQVRPAVMELEAVVEALYVVTEEMVELIP